ncbi:hypothetical protein [Gordonia sp. VNK21]|uniref:hypothetical protein n=1 Tax=Gordonia sp. VNK21 TaxID=3382483 RepID=UPI0038D48FEE
MRALDRPCDQDQPQGLGLYWQGLDGDSLQKPAPPREFRSTMPLTDGLALKGYDQLDMALPAELELRKQWLL